MDILLEEIGYKMTGNTYHEFRDHLLKQMRLIQGERVVVSYRFETKNGWKMARITKGKDKLLFVIMSDEELSKIYKRLETNSYDEAASFILSMIS